MSSTLKSIQELLTTLGWQPARVVSSKKLYNETREACIKIVQVGDQPIQLRSHPSLPDDMMIVFGAEGSFEVFKLEIENGH